MTDIHLIEDGCHSHIWQAGCVHAQSMFKDGSITTTQTLPQYTSLLGSYGHFCVWKIRLARAAMLNWTHSKGHSVVNVPPMITVFFGL